MNISPVLLYFWGALFFCFMGLLVYRGQLTRYEDEQLFLEDDAMIVQRNKMQKERIVSRLARIKPVLNVFGVAAGLVTTTVISLYVYNAWQTLQ